MPYDPMSRAEKERLGSVMLDLRRAMIVGNPAPVVSEMWQRHKHPQPGDWVIETSTLHALVRYPERWTPDRRKDLWDGQFTRYLRSEIRTDPEDPSWSEQVLICENPDGTEYAWTNAELAVVPFDRSLVSETISR